MAKVKSESVDSEQVEQVNEKPSGPFIYIGPDLQKFGLRQFSSFIGGEPKSFSELKKKTPEISQLLIPLTKLAEKRIELADRTSAAAVAYRTVLSLIV